MKCQYCGRINRTATDEVCNGCGANLSQSDKDVLDRWSGRFVEEDKLPDPYDVNRLVRLVTTTTTNSTAVFGGIMITPK